MPSFLVFVGSLLLAYFILEVYRFLVNLSKARKSGMPYVVIPLEQDGFIWMGISVPLRPWLVKNMPKWIWNRIGLTIHGNEFHEKLRPFEEYVVPYGNDKSYAIVSPGNFEVETADAEFATEVLRRPRDFVQIAHIGLILGRFGPNVLTTDGDSWARQRKVIAGVINERISKAVFNESLHQTEGLLDEVVGSDDAGETNRLFDMLKKITFNVLSGAGMGTPVDWSDNTNEKPRPGFRMTYVEAVKTVIHSVGGPIILPGWFLSNYPRFLPGYQNLNTVSHAVTEFPIHTQSLLSQERRRASAAGGETKNNIMSQMLQASEQSDADTKGLRGLSEEEMIGNLFIFTAAGFDTTANTLSYAIVMLCRYPQWQNWLFEEIDSIMPPDSTSNIDYVSIFPKAIRIQAYMFEVLRLFPPLVHIPKMTDSTQTIHTSHGSYLLPPKATIHINLVALGLDPDVWRNLNLGEDEEESETDELAFRPTRWIKSTPEGPQHFKPSKGAFLPWSAGPRVCPGQKMAQVEFGAIFLKLFHKHRVEAVPLKTESGVLETKDQLNSRLDARMRDSMSILTLQMNNIYDVENDHGKGLGIRVIKR